MKIQSAVEFLLTYSWAFIIIAFVVSMIFVLATGVSAPQYVGFSCSIEPSLPCQYSSIMYNSVSLPKFVLVMKNNLGVALSIPQNSITFSLLSSNHLFTGGCTPSFAPPGSQIMCIVPLNGISTSLAGSQQDYFTFSYKLCNSNTNQSCTSNQIYSTTGSSLQPLQYSSKGIYSLLLRDVPASGGSIILNGVSYPNGTLLNLMQNNYTLYAQPNASYIFNSWSSYSKLSSTTYQTTTVSLTQNSSVSAQFTYSKSSSTTVSVTTIYPYSTTVPQSAPIYYVIINLNDNGGSAAPVGFQQLIYFNPSTYSAYESSNLGNIRFKDNKGNLLYSWCESGCSSTASNAIFWVKMDTPINSGSNPAIINMTFQPKSTNYDGVYAGEAPTLSQTYGQYDNGANVFINYYPGNTISGWQVSGVAGVSSSLPAGSPFGSYGYYANSATGDFAYTNANLNPSNNYIIQYFVYTTGLGNLFFMANSGGTGVMDRLDSRGGNNYVGLAKTASWTSWYCPNSGVTLSPNTWYMFQIASVGGTQVGTWYGTGSQLSYASTSLNQINPLSTTFSDACGGGTETYSSDIQGGYMGYVGDGLGSSYITYWNGIIVRMYPPGGIMPSETLGPLQSTQSSSSSIVVPSGISYYVPITITNSQSSATPAPFQQLLNITESSFSSYIAYNNNLANFEYFYA
ncbi:MAG: InlB B-repeat-containing protein, partial [Candidatus Micrarchaeia archaeon]